MTASEIIARYELQVDDASELSSDEELDLLNEVYDEIANDRPWEWLKTTATGTTSTTVPYIALPANFKQLSVNQYNKSVIFVGTDYQEYEVIPFSNRRAYRNQDGFCYIDVVNQRLYFTLQPTSAKSIEYDYISRPTHLTLGTSPLFDSDNKIIAYGMAGRFNNIELSEKASSYQRENYAIYQNMLSEMRIEDSNIKLSV